MKSVTKIDAFTGNRKYSFSMIMQRPGVLSCQCYVRFKNFKNKKVIFSNKARVMNSTLKMRTALLD